MPVIDQAIRFRSELQRHETQATNQAIDAYKLLTNRLEDKLTVLQSKFEALEAKGQLTPENVRKLGVWSSLLQQLENEVDKFGGYVDTNNRVAATRSIEMAGKHAEKLTAINFETKPELNKAFNATWDRLPTESVETLLGFLQSDSPLRNNLTRSLGTNAAKNFQDKLLEGIGLGYNPRKINTLINQSLGEPLTWSINTVRTTQIYAYREAARANYVANSEIVGGWKWYAALDGRTCLSCVNQHGREFPVIAPLNDHHQGRCTQIPLINKAESFGLQSPQIETGEKWFNNLPKNQQIEMMGQERHRAYQQGKFKFQDLSETYENDSFGTMLKEASLKSILANQPQKQTISVPKNVSRPVSKTQSIAKPKQSNQKISNVLTIDTSLSKELQDAAKEALNLIEKVHGLPANISKIPIKELIGQDKNVHGFYRIKDDNSPESIEVSKNTRKPTMTILHEIGHYIDYHALTRLNISSARDLTEWREAIENSNAYKELKSMNQNPDKHKIEIGDYSIKPDREYTQYLLQYDELFARSYMQYIMTKNGRAKDVGYYTEATLYEAIQWQPNDFKQIEVAFDALLGKYK